MKAVLKVRGTLISIPGTNVIRQRDVTTGGAGPFGQALMAAWGGSFRWLPTPRRATRQRPLQNFDSVAALRAASSLPADELSGALCCRLCGQPVDERLLRSQINRSLTLWEYLPRVRVGRIAAKSK